MAKRIVRHTDLNVYKRAYAAAQVVFKLSKRFPKEEQYSLTAQNPTMLAQCVRKHGGSVA